MTTPTLITASILLFASLTLAQTANIKDLPLDENQRTTITIEKGAPTPTPGSQPVAHEVLEGTAEIEGDSAPLQKQAKANHKKACDEWKKEVKELNASNTILMINCNLPKCAPEATAMTVCRSTGTYKIRLKLQ